MTREAIDYGQWEAGRDVNYWELDRTLQYEARRTYPDEEFSWAEPRLAAFGDMVGSMIADNADRIDRHGPELHTYDRQARCETKSSTIPLRTRTSGSRTKIRADPRRLPRAAWPRRSPRTHAHADPAGAALVRRPGVRLSGFDDDRRRARAR